MRFAFLLLFALTSCGSADAGASALVSLARSESYRTWLREPAPHASTGPHGTVRTFVNDTLAKSLRDGAGTHPNGSVAVKELFDGGKRTGWAIDSKGEDGTWQFFEGFEPSLNQYFFRGTDNLCANCHRAGTDFVLTPLSALTEGP